MSYSPCLEECCLCLVLSKSQKHLLLLYFASHLKLTQFFHELKMKGFAVQTLFYFFMFIKCIAGCFVELIVIFQKWLYDDSLFMYRICLSNSHHLSRDFLQQLIKNCVVERSWQGWVCLVSVLLLLLVAIVRLEMVSWLLVVLKIAANFTLFRYTNYESQKAHELSENPQASLLFYWDGLNRQVFQASLLSLSLLGEGVFWGFAKQKDGGRNFIYIIFIVVCCMWAYIIYWSSRQLWWVFYMWDWTKSVIS